MNHLKKSFFSLFDNPNYGLSGQVLLLQFMTISNSQDKYLNIAVILKKQFINYIHHQIQRNSFLSLLSRREMRVFLKH
jgi:hypothetical protein